MGCSDFPKEKEKGITVEDSNGKIPMLNKLNEIIKEEKEIKGNKESKEMEENKETKISSLSIKKDFIIEIEEDKSKEKIDFRGLFMEGLSSEELINLFKKNSQFFYSQPFYEGLCKEYGLFGKSQNKKEAFEIYKNGADNKNDYLCMYRLHRIYYNEYNEFNLEKDNNFEKLYLYKCFAYLPYSIINGTYYIFNKINVTYYIVDYIERKDSNLHTFDKFINYLSDNIIQFSLSPNDIQLMKLILKLHINSLDYNNGISNIHSLLNLEKGDAGYYEAQLKYCNFYLDHFKYNGDKRRINDIFENLIKSGYYKACYDYANFLIEESDYDKAKDILKIGMENSQQFCFSAYYYLCLKDIEMAKLLMDYKIFEVLLDNMMLIMCLEKLNYSSVFYMFFYVSKHSTYKNILKRNHLNLLQNIYNYIETSLKTINNNSNKNIKNIYAEKYILEIPFIFGQMCFYGIYTNKSPDKNKALLYFKQSYDLAKENNNPYFIRINYLYIYKCRKFLFKNNNINENKFNKTKEKLCKLYFSSNMDNLSAFEVYNLYKIQISNNNSESNKGIIIRFLRKGTNYKMIYNFRDYIYINKCSRKMKEYENYCSICYINKDNLIKMEPCKDLICQTCFKDMKKDVCPTCGKTLENSE